MKYQLTLSDYSAIVIMLVISTVIGFKFRVTSKQKITTREYFMAGQNMSKLPVILSITVSIVSAVIITGAPAEMYRYGMELLLAPVGTPLGMALAAYVLIPVYFQCGVSTVYEYIDLRFGRETRYILSTCFILQTTLCMAPILYAPVLAISAVTDFSVEAAIFILGSICTLYSTLGGLKGVLWADVFQSSLMFLSVIVVFTAGISDVGGFANAFEKVKEGGRMQLNTNLDFTARYTIWDVLLIRVFTGFNNYGANQIEVQRLLSLSNIKRAKSSLLISSIPVTLFSLLCVSCGFALYAVYHLCDPVLNKDVTGLTKYDQLMPFYIINKFHNIPGVTGLLVAGIFCGSLTTISSALNSLATVTVVDYARVLLPRLSDVKFVYIATAFTVLYGGVIILLTFAIKETTSIVQTSALLFSIVDSPSAAIFTVGVLTRKGSSRSVLAGFFAGVAFMSWIAFGSMFGGYKHPMLPLTTSGCEVSNSSIVYVNSTTTCWNVENCTSTEKGTHNDIFVLYRIGYMWTKMLGFVITLVFILFAILITGWKEADNPPNVRCLSPVTRLWNKIDHPPRYADVAVEEIDLNGAPDAKVPEQSTRV